MPHTVRQLPDEPIFIVTYEEPFDYALGFDDIKQTIAKMAEEMEGPVYDIHDACQLRLSFSKVVVALANALLTPVLKGKTNTLVVGSGMLFDLASKAAGQKQYGQLDVSLFQTLEEAISHARECLKKP